MPSTPILEIVGLTVRRGRTRILSGVDWTVHRGEHWVILGSNGSGKTSLLCALTGYLMPTAGIITLLGKRYGQADWRELRTRIGLVSSSIRQMMPPDEPALETVISGKRAMIDYWGPITRSDRRRGLHLLRQVESRHLADRPWQVLSQGERQRVLIGRALMADLRLLILDEPCAGLDPVAREHFLQFLERLGRRKRAPTLVLVTHHVEEITPVFTHVLILKSGEVLVADSKRRALTSKYLSLAFCSAVRLKRRGREFTLSVCDQTGRVF